MVLVRIRVEKANAPVEYLKSLQTLPADVLVSKLLSDNIAPKIQLTDLTDYNLYDIGTTQDGTIVQKFNLDETLAGKVKNGAWLLVKYDGM